MPDITKCPDFYKKTRLKVNKIFTRWLKMADQIPEKMIFCLKAEELLFSEHISGRDFPAPSL